MKTKLFFLTLLMILPFYLQAQQTWQWGKRGGSTTTQFNGTPFREPVLDMATDPNGNVYMVANVGGENLEIDGTNLNFHFLGDYYGYIEKYIHGGLLMSYDCDGNFRWSKLISGTQGLVRGLETDTLGNIYMTTKVGSATKDIWGTEYLAHFDTDTIIPYSANPKKYKQTKHIIQYDTLGNLKRLMSYEQDSIQYLPSRITTDIFDIIVEPNGVQHVFIIASNYYEPQAGTVYYPIVEGDTLVPGHHIIKYDVQGNYLGNIKLDMEMENNHGGAFVPKINHDPVRKAYYMTGYNETASGASQDSLWVGGQLVNSYMFVAKFDSLGNSRWLKQAQQNIEVSNKFDDKPEIDEHGNIILSAIFKHNNNPTNFNGFIPQSSTSSSIPAIVKMDKEGNLIYGVNPSSTETGSPKPTIHLSGNIISLAGSQNGITWGNQTFAGVAYRGYDMYHARFNAQTGAIISMDTLRSNVGFSEYPTAITGDKRGNVYIGGEFKGKMYVNQDTLTNIHYGVGSDYFLVKSGQANCNCTLPEAGFSYTGANATVNFTYNGTTGYDSLEWGFDDGMLQSTTTNSISHTFIEDREYWICVTAYNSCGYDTWCTLVDPYSLQTEALAKESFSFYPNPVKENLNIEAQEALSYTLYTIAGKNIQNGDLNPGENRINTSTLSSGLYMLQVKNKAGSQRTVKLIKE